MSGYFTFTPAEEAYLNEITRNQEAILSPYAARSDDAVRAREHVPNFAIIRPPFTYDVDKIIHSPLYNRYSDKTQVFSFYRNDDLSRRALHVQFVSKLQADALPSEPPGRTVACFDRVKNVTSIITSTVSGFSKPSSAPI